jgi:amino acid adenylation domain-containing protein
VSTVSLVDFLETSAAAHPDRIALVDPRGVQLAYHELNHQSDCFAAFLTASGVSRGDRVGVALPKGAAAVVALFGILKAGAAYVPVDFSAPPERVRKILMDCDVRAAVVDQRSQACVSRDGLAALIVDGFQEPLAPGSVRFSEVIRTALPRRPVGQSLDDLAYILYTSGSTGVPKGVMLTHRNAVSFVDWCSSVFAPVPEDRFSSHAPLHFDLSVLDIYLPIKHGATVCLISEDVARSPRDLARFISRSALTVWYSTPSILTLLVQFGNLTALDCSSLRTVLFAGEVFPVRHLRDLKAIWPGPRYYNLYGPTETNVCTFAEIPQSVPADRESPYPIGAPCEHCQALVLDGDGQEVPRGSEGLLYIAGPSVFQGYWNRPVENAAAFIERNGVRWYNTGDVVRWTAEGFTYVGRRDRMVKRRGFRIELGEIERALHLHPQLRQAAVIAMADPDAGVRIVAFVVPRDGTALSVIDLKRFCATKLPTYMSPDRFVIQEHLPQTSTDKTDYQALRTRASDIDVQTPAGRT